MRGHGRSARFGAKTPFNSVFRIILALRTIQMQAPVSCSLDFFLQAEDGIRYLTVTGVQTCALPICTNVTSYQVLLGTTSGTYERVVDAGGQKTVDIAEATPGQTYFIVVRASDAHGALSDQIGRASCRERV